MDALKWEISFRLCLRETKLADMILVSCRAGDLGTGRREYLMTQTQIEQTR